MALSIFGLFIPLLLCLIFYSLFRGLGKKRFFSLPLHLFLAGMLVPLLAQALALVWDFFLSGFYNIPVFRILLWTVIPEECGRLIILLILLRRFLKTELQKETAATALFLAAGFTLTENIIFFFQPEYFQNTMLRSFTVLPLHYICFFILGYSIFKFDFPPLIIIAFLLSAALHLAYNLLIHYQIFPALFIFLVILYLLIIFIFLERYLIQSQKK